LPKSLKDPWVSPVRPPNAHLSVAGSWPLVGVMAFPDTRPLAHHTTNSPSPSWKVALDLHEQAYHDVTLASIRNCTRALSLALYRDMFLDLMNFQSSIRAPPRWLSPTSRLGKLLPAAKLQAQHTKAGVGEEVIKIVCT
jgi:hypothetical protein